MKRSRNCSRVWGAGAWPLRTGGTAQLLNNGKEYLPAMLEAFRGAQKTIDFSAYIWEKGQISDQFLAVFLERARAGVQVRVLLDGMGGMQAPSMDELKAAGGKVVVFRPARWGKFTRFHKRNHRRAIVIDGTVSFTGGAAVADHWLGDAANEEQWRDTMGPTDPAKAAPGTLRRDFGQSIGRNATHGSDAPDTAAFELGYFFRGMELV